ncbi:MAG: glycosyltransferase family 39 protein [Ignavibacteria bacterium]|nr:glycosyltransferase family 39 protein [Ignavibacteria bacterium]
MPKGKTGKKTEKKKQQPAGQINLSQKFEELTNNRFLGLGIAVVYFVVMAIISFSFHRVGDYGVETDFFWGYVPAAKDFLNGVITIDAFRGPLYPIVLGIFGFILSDFFNAGILIGILSAAFVVYFTFEMVKRIFSTKVALFVTLILACNPVFVQYTYSAGTDMFFSALITATLFFFFKEKELSYKNLAIAAFLGGLSYLTRYNGIFLFGFVIVILLINYWNIDWLKRFKVAAVFVVVFVLTFSPWGIYCSIEKDSFFYNENYKNIAYEMHGKGKISWDEYWFEESSKVTSLQDIVFSDPGTFLSKVIKNVGDHFMEDMEKLVGWHIGVFVILGLILLLLSNPLKDWKSRETGFYLLSILFFGLLLLIFYSERFSMFLIPFYTVLAVQPFFISKYKIQKFAPLKFSYILMIGLVAFTFAKSYSFNSSRIDSGPKELLVLKEWYDKNIPESERGEKIASRKAHVAYYLDMKFSLIPMADTYEELITKLKENKVDHLYFSTMEAAMRRQFQFLLDPRQNHTGLETVVYFDNPPAVLYKLVDK